MPCSMAPDGPAIGNLNMEKELELRLTLICSSPLSMLESEIDYSIAASSSLNLLLLTFLA